MKTLKILATITGGILAIIFTWYSISRIKAINTPILVYSINKNIEEKVSYTGKLKVASYILLMVEVENTVQKIGVIKRKGNYLNTLIKFPNK